MATTWTKKHLGFGLLLVCGLVCLFPHTSAALILGGEDEPRDDAGWPLGCVEMANLPTRVAWWEGPPFGGGEWHFLYRCESTEQFNEALRTFAAIRAPSLELVLHDGPRYGQFYAQKKPDPEESQPGAEDRFDWTFTIWNPERFHSLSNSIYRRELGGPRPAPAPLLDVYLGGGSIDWNQVELPDGLTVTDQRAESAPEQLVGGSLICGEVYDIRTGKPIAGAEVLLTNVADEAAGAPLLTRTDALGSFRIERPPESWHRLTVRAQGYAPRQLSDLYDTAGRRYHRITTTLVPTAKVEGIVTALDGTPIAGALVEALRDTVCGLDGAPYDSPDSDEAWSAATSTMSDEQGRFEIGGLPMGLVELGCTVPGRYPVVPVGQIEVPGGPVEIRMEGTGTVRGKVVDAQGKTPSEEADVYLRRIYYSQTGGMGYSMPCEADGSFEFTGVPPGEYLLISGLPFDLDFSDPNLLRLKLRPGETVEVVVRQHDELRVLTEAELEH